MSVYTQKRWKQDRRQIAAEILAIMADQYARAAASGDADRAKRAFAGLVAFVGEKKAREAVGIWPRL